MTTETDTQPNVPNVVALAGRRTDEPKADEIRFPLSNAELVRQRLRDHFVREGFTSIVSSAACGADLLALGVATELGMRAFVVLPFAPTIFRRLSVTDRPGNWGEVFDRVIEQATKDNILKVLDYDENDPTAFTETNKVIVALAREQAGSGALPVCTLVWEGRPKEKEDATQQFGELCRQAGFRVTEVSTLE